MGCRIPRCIVFFGFMVSGLGLQPFGEYRTIELHACDLGRPIYVLECPGERAQDVFTAFRRPCVAKGFD